MPIKVTWKSIVGFLSMLGGALTATNVEALHLPHVVSGALVGAGGLIIFGERLAETLDYRTDGGAKTRDQLDNRASIIATLEKDGARILAAKTAAEDELTKVKSEIDAAYTKGRADVVAELQKGAHAVSPTGGGETVTAVAVGPTAPAPVTTTGGLTSDTTSASPETSAPSDGSGAVPSGDGAGSGTEAPAIASVPPVPAVDPLGPNG